MRLRSFICVLALCAASVGCGGGISASEREYFEAHINGLNNVRDSLNKKRDYQRMLGELRLIRLRAYEARTATQRLRESEITTTFQANYHLSDEEIARLISDKIDGPLLDKMTGGKAEIEKRIADINAVAVDLRIKYTNNPRATIDELRASDNARKS